MDNKEQIMKDYQDTNDTKVSNDKLKKKKKFNIWAFLLIICILLIIGVFVFFFVFALKPKNILVNGTSKMINTIYKVIEPMNVEYNYPDNFSINNNTKISYSGTNETYTTLLENAQLNTNLMYDGQAKKMYLDLDSNISDSIINIDYYINDLEQYFFFEEVTDNFVRLEDLTNSVFLNSMITFQDLVRYYNIASTIISNNINEAWVDRDIAISLDPTATVKLTLSKNNYYKILNEIKNELLNESKILQLISNYYGEEYTKNLRELEIKNESEDVADYLTVLVEQSIIKDNLKKVEITQKETNVTTKFVFTNNDGNIVMNTYENDEIINEAKLKVDGKNFDLILNSDQDNPSTLKGSEADGFYTYTLTVLQTSLDATDSALIGPAPSQNFEITYKFKNTIGSNLTYENSFTINVQQDTFTLNNTGTISSLGQEINVDTSNYIDYEQINTQQLQTRYARVLEPLINVIVGTNTL